MHLLGAEPTRVADRGETRTASAIERELERLIERADWQKLRPAAFAEASVAPDRHAKERRDGDAPDLSGIGSVVALDRFARVMKEIQLSWPSITLADRALAIRVGLDQELVAAQIPPLEKLETLPAKKHPASFNYKKWELVLRQEFLEGGAISDAAAADLCGTLVHEVRHAEQQFLTARFLAAQGKSTTQIAATLKELHPPIAAKAVAMKLDGLDSAKLAFAKRMHSALVTHRDVTDMLDADPGYDQMKAARAKAQEALAGLRARPPTVSEDAARAACHELRERIEEVLSKYKIYRQFPTEADAHEVGAGGKLAFEELG